MSAICGICRRAGEPVVSEELGAAMKVLMERQIDAQDLWSDGRVAFGHVLHRTTPESAHEKQPLRSRDGRLTLTAAARIDNRDELIRALALQSAPGVIPDSELILAAYEKWGTAAPGRLVGDFAFAVWDSVEEQFFCARDPIGIRPLYYHHSTGGFAFASEIGALLALPGVPRQVNDAHVLAYLADLDGDVASTFYRGIQRLPGGHALTLRPGGEPSVWPYWRPEETIQPLRLHDDGAYEDGFRAVFEEAVRSCLRSATPVGIQLSGGMDSSAIACVARHLRSGEPEPLYTFSGIFPSLPEPLRVGLDERRFLEDVLAGGNFSPFYIRADEISPLNGLDLMVSMRGQPFKARGHYFMLNTLQEAQRRGIRVLLDGAEGDLVVGYGFDYFAELAEQGDWPTFAAVARAYADNCRRGGRLYPPGRAFWDEGLQPLVERLRSGRLGDFIRDVQAVSTVLDIRRSSIMAAAIKQLVPRTALRRMQRLRGHVPPEVVDPSLLEEAGVRITDRRSGRGSGLRRRVALLKGNPMIAEAMEGIDPIFSRFGVEARHPFYDRRVMEYCLSLPAEQRMKGGWTRSIMRRALRDVLPESVQHRVGKALLGKNTVHNMHEHERESLQRLLGDAVLRPYLPAETAERLYRGFLAQPTGKHANPLLRIAALAAWLHDEAMRFPSNGERHECAKST